jgi:phenylacetate-coenzyme A ligase PaaK-like adenylate-forming protein
MECSQLESYLINKVEEAQTSDSTHAIQIRVRGVWRSARNDIERYQLLLLRKALTYAYGRSAFYRAAFVKQGIGPEALESLKDLSRFPFTEPDEVARNPYVFACVSESLIERAVTFISSGTTGPQKRVFFTIGDLERITDFMAAGMRTVASAGDIVQIMLPAGPANGQADLLSKGVRKMGGVPIITGTAATATQMDSIRQHHPKILFGFTSNVYRLTLEAQPYYSLPELGVRTLFLSSEYLSSAMRENLRQIWQAQVVTHYGLTEMGLGVAVECRDGDGYHFNEADLLLEIVDPETGTVLLGGEEGELVFTTLNREAMPLLRYRTHDIARMVDRPCTCGAGSLRKFSAVARRREDLVSIGRFSICSALLDEALFGLAALVDWRAEIVRNATTERLSIHAEQSPGSRLEEEDVRGALLSVDAIRQSLQSGALAAIDVKVLPPGGLVRGSRAKKLILEAR